VQTFEDQVQATLVLRLQNGETIETTKEHPFYVESQGFTPAGEMGIGTSIVTRAGPAAILASSQVLNQIAPVYNGLHRSKPFHLIVHTKRFPIMFHPSISRRFLLATPLFLTTLSLAFLDAPHAFAQQASPAITVPRTSFAPPSRDADAGAIADLQRELAPLEKTAPAQAIARYRSFAAERFALSSRARLAIADAIAQVQLNGLRDTDAALATYASAFGEFPTEPFALNLLVESSKILIANNRAPAAETLIRAQWPLVLSASPNVASPVIQQLARSLTQQGKKAELVEMLEEVLVKSPAFLDDGTQSRPQRDQSRDSFLLQGTDWGWMYDGLEKALLDLGQTDRALGWAKARYMTAITSSGAVDRATRSLARVAMAKDPSGALAWSLAQVRGGAVETDPLQSVALPAALKNLDIAKSRRDRDQVGVLIAHGDLDQALLKGARSLVSDPNKPYGALDIARTFKAVDLNTDRANQWLEFARTGRGTNPLSAYFGERKFAEIEKVSALAGSTTALQKLRPFDEQASEAPYKVVLLKAGKLTPQAAWESGALDADEVLYILQRGAGLIDGEGQNENKGIRLDLVGVMVKHQPQLLQPTDDNQSLMLPVSDYYIKNKDPRTEGLLQLMLKQGAAQTVEGKTTPRAWFYRPVLNRLADYYRNTGRPEKSRDLYASEGEQTRDSDPIASSVATFEAARSAQLAGDTEGADELYAQVVSGGYGWTAGLALWDRANALIEQGQHEKARQLLQQPVTGVGVDKVRVGLQALLALSYYRTGEIEPARAAAQASLDAFAVSDVREGRGVVEQANSARELLARLDGWQRQPIQVEPAELRFGRRAIDEITTLSSAKDAAIVRYVRVKTLTDEPLEAVSDNPKVQVQMLEEIVSATFSTVRELQISVPLLTLRQGLNADITIRSKDNPQRAVVLPLSSLQGPQDEA